MYMYNRLKIGVLFSRVRVEEKWIFASLEKRGIDYERLDDRTILFDLEDPEPWRAFDAVLERSISFTSGLYALRILNSFGVADGQHGRGGGGVRRQADHQRGAGPGWRATAAQRGGLYSGGGPGGD